MAEGLLIRSRPGTRPNGVPARRHPSAAGPRRPRSVEGDLTWADTLPDPAATFDPAPLSPQMSTLRDRARALRWEVLFQGGGDSPGSRELEDVERRITALKAREHEADASER